MTCDWLLFQFCDVVEFQIAQHVYEATDIDAMVRVSQFISNISWLCV